MLIISTNRCHDIPSKRLQVSTPLSLTRRCGPLAHATLPRAAAQMGHVDHHGGAPGDLHQVRHEASNPLQLLTVDYPLDFHLNQKDCQRFPFMYICHI